jgi:hypothetical protein
MASDISIANRALQELGDEPITSLSDGNTRARAVNVAFEPARQAELRAHPWNFAVRRASLAASATAPAFGPSNAFPLPSDFLKLLPPDEAENYNSRDWIIEGRSVLTYDSAPLEIRYIADITDANTMDSLFREALALRIADALCEKLTQSNTKREAIAAKYVRTIREARRANAFDNVPKTAAEDSWITVRA